MKMDVLLFPPLFMALKCLFYHACQALLAHEKVIFAREKKGEHIVAGEILETVGLERVATQSGDCMVVCFGLSVSF